MAFPARRATILRRLHALIAFAKGDGILASFLSLQRLSQQAAADYARLAVFWRHCFSSPLRPNETAEGNVLLMDKSRSIRPDPLRAHAFFDTLCQNATLDPTLAFLHTFYLNPYNEVPPSETVPTGAPS